MSATRRDTHGGRREGAGRKPGDPQMRKIPVSTRLPRWLADWLRSQPNQSAAIADALISHHTLSPPGGPTVSQPRITQNGMKQIRRYLAAHYRHPLDQAPIHAIAAEVLDNLSAGRGARFQIQAPDAHAGEPVTCEITPAGYAPAE